MAMHMQMGTNCVPIRVSYGQRLPTQNTFSIPNHPIITVPQLAEFDHMTFTTSSQLKKSAHLTNGFSHPEGTRDEIPEQDPGDDEFAIVSTRNLMHDLCIWIGDGHGDSAPGIATIDVALWKYAHAMYVSLRHESSGVI